MKELSLAIILSTMSLNVAAGSDAEEGSTEQFKVSYVETEDLPSLAVISKELEGRKEALEEYERHVAEGLDAARLAMMRRETLRQMYFPIRVNDLKTGNVYEVQTDRRTIIAKSKDGKELWKVNPYIDAKLTELKGPLKMHFHKYPYICYFGKTWTKVRSVATDYTLQLTFTSKEFGGFDLKTGKFTLWGSD
jgi:hypothetical protein